MFLVDNGLGILANTEDDNLLDIQDQMGGVLVAPGLQSGLVQTSSALNRWTEEATILDGDSIHDCITALKPDILVIVEKQRDEELAEKRERRRKQQEEEAARRKEDEEREKSKNAASSAAGTTTPSSGSASTIPAISSSTSSTAPPVAPQESITMDVAPTSSLASSSVATAPTSGTPSFSSFFHGFNMQAGSNNPSMTSTPTVRPHDHAETLATSIVEAVLGPALESVSNQVRPPHSSAMRDQPPDVVANLPLAAVTPSDAATSSALASSSGATARRSSAISETPISSGATEVGLGIQVDSTPYVDRAATNQSNTPLNPIPNATPSAPAVPRSNLQDNPFISDSASTLRRPLAFQEESTPSHLEQESHTVEGTLLEFFPYS